MQKSRIVQFVILGVGLVLALVCFLTQVRQIGSLFSNADTVLATLWLSVAFVIGVATSAYNWTRVDISRLIVSGIALFVALFTLLVSTQYPLLAAIGVWLCLYAVFHQFLVDCQWTRALGLAAIPAIMTYMMASSTHLALFREHIGQWTIWMTSVFLDATTIPHVRLDEAIRLLDGETVPQSSLQSWCGILPVIALAVIPVTLFRHSLFQFILMAFGVMATWIFISAMTTWFGVWQGGGMYHMGQTNIFFGVVACLACTAMAICIGSLTQAIPLGRTDWNYPVATYFWNFFTQLPASILSESAAMSEADA